MSAIITRTDWADQIRARHQATVEGFLDVGRLLIEAKAALPHGEFEAMVESDLPFGARTAQRLMAIASHPILTRATHVSVLPAAWGTLYELTKLPDDIIEAALADGSITPRMERKDVARLLPAKAPRQIETPNVVEATAVNPEQAPTVRHDWCADKVYQEASPLASVILFRARGQQIGDGAAGKRAAKRAAAGMGVLYEPMPDPVLWKLEHALTRLLTHAPAALRREIADELRPLLDLNQRYLLDHGYIDGRAK